MNINRNNIVKFKKSFTGIIPVMVFLLSAALFFQGCALNKAPQPQDNEIELKLMEKRISFMEKKLEKIYSRLSIIQFMVDNHELMLKTSYPLQKKEGETPEAKENLSENKEKEALADGTDNKEKISPEQLYSRGIRLINEKIFDSAIKTFDIFIKKYPDHKLADNSLYWRGECFYTQKNFSEAVKSFEQVTTDYPGGSKYPDALLKAGYSYIELGNTQKAKEALQKVIKLYPFSNAAPKAEVKLKELL